MLSEDVARVLKVHKFLNLSIRCCCDANCILETTRGCTTKDDMYCRIGVSPSDRIMTDFTSYITDNTFLHQVRPPLLVIPNRQRISPAEPSVSALSLHGTRFQNATD